MPSYCIMPLAIAFLLAQPLHAQNSAKMFLGTPAHIPLKNTSAGDCFNKMAWKTNAGAAVRTTPVADTRNIYFGSEKGDFFCLDQATGKILWKFTAPYPIHSSAALKNGNVFFSDSKQTLYALVAATGKVKWRTSLGESRPYNWAFDFLWSSPVISGDTLYAGSGDGNLYAVNISNGNVFWKFGASGHIRCTPAVAYGKVFFGDMNGIFFALNSATGKKIWQYETHGSRFVNDSFGYDRKGIVSSPVVIGNKIVFGSRDGYMYNLNTENGDSSWIFNYDITWVISSVATDGTAVYAGTSDGRYVNAIDLETGRELWKSETNIVWSSPVLIKDKLYVGGYDGYLYCMDKKTGLKSAPALHTAGRIQSSPIITGNHLFIGSDDGYVYAMQNNGTCKTGPQTFIKYVYYDRGVPRLYYRNGTDILLRATLADNGFRQIDAKGLEDVFKKDIPADSNTVVVLASEFFPSTVTRGGKGSLLRHFLDKGGRLVITGLNPIVFSMDEKTNDIKTDFTAAKAILDIDFRYNDSRAHGGVVYCAATTKGTLAGLPAWWMAPFSIDKKQVDVVLGENINKDASAYVKKYSSKPNSGLIQIWIDAEFMPADIKFVQDAALADL